MPISEKKKITNDRYLSKFLTKSIRIPKELEEPLNAAASAAGQSTSAYILQAVLERMTRDGTMEQPTETP